MSSSCALLGVITGTLQPRYLMMSDDNSFIQYVTRMSSLATNWVKFALNRANMGLFLDRVSVDFGALTFLGIVFSF